MGKSAGKIMPLPRGAYDATATYNILDMVTLNNKLWVAKKSGVKGVTPSDDAAEWMMAVDGTTDVKGLETTVNEKFSEIDTKFTGYDTDLNALHTQGNTTETNVRNLSTTVGNLNTSVSGLSTRCANIEGAIVPDTTATKDSNKLITSGAVYAMLNYKESKTPDSSGYFEAHDSSVTCNRVMWIDNRLEQHYVNSDGSKQHRVFTNNVNMQGTSVNINAYQHPASDNTVKDNNFEQNLEATIAVCPGRIRLSTESDAQYVRNNTSEIYLYITPDSFTCQDDSVFDLGSSDRKFKDIYAQTASIQTSDRNEKKDIAEINRASEFIMGLKPVSYKFINGSSGRTHYGLIAQDVEELLTNLGMKTTDFAGFIKSQKREDDQKPIDGEYTYGLRYEEFIAPLIAMCQNLQNEVTELRAEIETLKNK